MLTLLLIGGAFLAYRLYAKSRATGTPVLPPSVMPTAAGIDAMIQQIADRHIAETLGKILAGDTMKAKAELHARAAEAATGPAPSVPPKA